MTAQPLMPLRDETAQPTPARQMALADFACPLCMELLYKPCTIDCGHNVCQPWCATAASIAQRCSQRFADGSIRPRLVGGDILV